MESVTLAKMSESYGNVVELRQTSVIKLITNALTSSTLALIEIVLGLFGPKPNTDC